MVRFRGKADQLNGWLRSVSAGLFAGEYQARADPWRRDGREHLWILRRKRLLSPSSCRSPTAPGHLPMPCEMRVGTLRCHESVLKNPLGKGTTSRSTAAL